MDRTPNLDMPYILPSQAQKHVTHNEALQKLDSLVQLAVIDRDLVDPPVAPNDGDRYIVGPAATGAWAGQDSSIATYVDGSWTFIAPGTGWLCWVADEQTLQFWDGSAWVGLETALSALHNLALLGIGTSADAANPLSAKLNNALLTAKYAAEGGDGDLRVKANKEAAAGTVSYLFQTGYSGRAEFGLTGDDDFSVKVSADGAGWTEALKVDRNDGKTRIQGLRHAASGSDLASMLFTPGGTGVAGIYRQNPESGQNPRAFTISAVSGDTITLTTADAAQVYDATEMTGVSYARIWNTSKTPEQSAWVKAQPGANQLQVTNAADIAGWLNSETVQIGDPTSVTPNRCITLDISPMLINLFGQAFRQKGILVKANILTGTGGTSGDNIAISPSGASGTFVQAAQLPSSAGVTIIPCTDLSPISNSNLVRLRETIAGTAGIRLSTSMAVFV